MWPQYNRKLENTRELDTKTKNTNKKPTIGDPTMVYGLYTTQKSVIFSIRGRTRDPTTNPKSKAENDDLKPSTFHLPPSLPISGRKNIKNYFHKGVSVNL